MRTTWGIVWGGWVFTKRSSSFSDSDFYLWGKTRQERLIAASALEWVIVRPGVLTNRARRSAYRHGPDVGNFVGTVTISRADVADFMLNQITDDTYFRTTVGVCW